MSKTHSIPLNKIYLGELIVIGLCLAVVTVVAVSKIVLLVKTPSSPPTVDLQQLELQKAINVIKSPTPN